MQVNQSQAARELGWTQGALSQYLNNITDLNAAAVIKLANFLDVSPTDIDPTVEDILHKVESIEIRYHSTSRSPVNETAHPHKFVRDKTFGIVAKHTLSCHTKRGLVSFPTGNLILCRDIGVQDVGDDTVLIAAAPGATRFDLYTKANLPKRTTLRFSVVGSLYL
jgi:transcriptional regulator with XRE-family HTH domain